MVSVLILSIDCYQQVHIDTNIEYTINTYYYYLFYQTLLKMMEVKCCTTLLLQFYPVIVLTLNWYSTVGWRLLLILL